MNLHKRKIPRKNESKFGSPRPCSLDWTVIVAEHGDFFAQSLGFKFIFRLRQSCRYLHMELSHDHIWKSCNKRLVAWTLHVCMQRAILANHTFAVNKLMKHSSLPHILTSRRWIRQIPAFYRPHHLIFQALAQDNIHVVDKLAQICGDVMLVLKDEFGDSCFHKAALKDSAFLLCLLGHVSQNATLAIFNNHCQSALNLAIANGKTENAEILASFDRQLIFRIFPIQEGVAMGNAIHQCAWHGDCVCFETLAKLVDVSTLFGACSSGYTTLMISCVRGDLEMTSVIINFALKCPDHDKFLSMQSSLGQTCLHLAALSCNQELVIMLLKHLPTYVVQYQNVSGQLAVDICAGFGMNSAVKAIENHVLGK